MQSKLKHNSIMANKHQLTTADHLPYNEFDKLLAGLRQDGNYFWEMYARLSFCTACRASDVLKFKWSDVLKKSCVITEQKTGKTRRISFNPSVQKKIQELYKLMGSPDKDSYVFSTNRSSGEPVSIQYVNRQLKKFKYRYKLPIDHFSSHTFRKTFGRYVYDKSNHSAESLLLLNKILNHSNIQVTKTYIGITQDEINSIYDSIAF